MSDEKEGNDVAGVVGGVAGGAGAGYMMYDRQKQRLMDAALTDVDALSQQKGRFAGGRGFVEAAQRVVTPELTKEYEAAKAATKSADGAKLKGENGKLANELLKGVEKKFTDGMKAEKKGFARGITLNQKGKVAAAAVAGIAVGGFVLNALFGGKHTNKIEAERAQAASTETARA